jgi:hypothetical protein
VLVFDNSGLHMSAGRIFRARLDGNVDLGPVTRWAAWSCCRRVAQRNRAHGCRRLTEAEFRHRRVVMILVNSWESLRADRGALDRKRFAPKPGERWRF